MADRINLDDWGLLAQFSQVFRTTSDVFTDEEDMPRGQAMVLCTVVKQDGLTQSEIAEQLSVQGPTITTMLQKMEEVGLVSRSRDPEDNRQVRVFVTEESRQKESAINAQFGSMQEKIFEGISQAERALLRQWLSKMIKSITE